MISELFLKDMSLWGCVWQSTLFAVLGLLGSFLLRRRPARACQVLILAMIAAVLVPTMSVLVKHFELGMFEAEPIARQLETRDMSPATLYGASLALPTPESQPEVHEGVTDFEGSSGGAGIPWRTTVLCGWMIATLILLGRLLVAFVSGVFLLRRAQSRGCEQIQQAADSARARLGITKDLQVRSSKDVHSPVIWCWRPTPVLLVPGDLDYGVDWEGVICHELAHWRRWDHVSGLIAELIVCILPWNPLLWWSKKRMVRLSEQACDDWVVAGGRPCEDYAQSLLNFKPQRQVAFVPAVVHSKRGLADRVRRILKDSCGNPRTGAVWALAVSIVAACLAVGVACAQTRPAEPEAATQREDKPIRSLVEAVIYGDTDQAALRIAEGADVNAEVYLGHRPLLHHAVRRGDESMVELLLSKGADVNARNQWGETALHDADEPDIALLLVKAGADLNAKDNKSRTPLYKAAWQGMKDVADLLLTRGASTSAKNRQGRTPLHSAAAFARPDIVELLIAKGAEIDPRDNEGHTPLYLAMHSFRPGDKKPVIQLLATRGGGVSATHLAAYLGDLAKVKEAVQGGLSINSRDEGGFTLLHAAAKGGQTETVEFLLASGADVNDNYGDGGTPLHFAAGADVAKLLIDKGADVNAKTNTGLTPLHWNISDRSKDVAEVLISNGADIDLAADHGVRPLNLAVWFSSKSVAELLIGKGADVNAKDEAGLPLHASVSLNNKDITELLIANGADVNMKRGTHAERTVLFLAVQYGYSDMTALLVDKGADVNVRVDGDTLLHAAVRSAVRETAEILITNGADVNAKDKEGRTPLSIAKEEGYIGMVKLLLKHGAKE